MRCWGGRFEGSTDERAADYTRSLELDRALAGDDLTASVAHVRGLARAGVLDDEDADLLVDGLEALRKEVESGSFAWDETLEDVHLNLESALQERVGPLAAKLRTGRSRNDQVATDLRLWLRRAQGDLDAAIVALERALLAQAERHPDVVMPGSTHLQPAQPVLFAHHLLAYVEMLERDRARFGDAQRRANVSPLGSGALAGSGFAIDREAVARELGFDSVTRNSVDAVSDRDFVAETLGAVALAMVHLSRLAEELTWWSSPRFGYVRVADAFSTGSSMMPNKRNPDPAELVRARAGRVIGQLAGFLTVLKGLPLGYQRDLQEDKAALFDSVSTLSASLAVMIGIVETLSVNRHAMHAAAEEGYITATALADELVRRGVSFRDAHRAVGRMVALAEARGLPLRRLEERAVREALGEIGADAETLLAKDRNGRSLLDAADVEVALGRCDVLGGTAPRRVADAIAATRARLEGES